MIEADANLLTVGLPAIFWFHMNWGIYFRDIKKTMLTIINIFVLAIACAIVSHRLSGIIISPLPLFFDLALFSFDRELTFSSVVWVSGYRQSLSMRTLAPGAGLVPIMLIAKSYISPDEGR